jgi:hypothetical protein
MKNLKTTLFLFSFCVLITTQFTFAQEDAKSTKEQVKLSEQTTRDTAKNEDLAKVQKEKELKDVTELKTKKDLDFSEKEAIIKNAKMRIEMAKAKLASEIEKGTISEKDIRIKENKIAQLEEKLMNHTESLNKAEKGNKELSKKAEKGNKELSKKAKE